MDEADCYALPSAKHWHRVDDAITHRHDLHRLQRAAMPRSSSSVGVLGLNACRLRMGEGGSWARPIHWDLTTDLTTED